jgi:predicted phosphodiesterase
MMTKPVTVGLIADIHANGVALDAVLDDMPPVDALVCLGDIVGYNAQPGYCVERVRSECDVVIQGNHDRDLGEPEQYRETSQTAYQGLQYAAENLTDEDIRWLSELPPTHIAFRKRLYSVHSHPENTDEYVSKGEFTTIATRMTEEMQALALAHTHNQAAVDMSKFSRHGVVVNPGSVGQPRDNDPRAAYAVLDLMEPSVDLRRVEYSIGQIQEANEKAGLPEKTSRRLETGT